MRDFGAATSTVALASESLSCGTINSDCSKPSVAMMRILACLMSGMTFSIVCGDLLVNGSGGEGFRSRAYRNPGGAVLLTQSRISKKRGGTDGQSRSADQRPRARRQYPERGPARFHSR